MIEISPDAHDVSREGPSGILEELRSAAVTTTSHDSLQAMKKGGGLTTCWRNRVRLPRSDRRTRRRLGKRVATGGGRRLHQGLVRFSRHLIACRPCHAGALSKPHRVAHPFAIPPHQGVLAKGNGREGHATLSDRAFRGVAQRYRIGLSVEQRNAIGSGFPWAMGSCSTASDSPARAPRLQRAIERPGRAAGSRQA